MPAMRLSVKHVAIVVIGIIVRHIYDVSAKHSFFTPLSVRKNNTVGDFRHIFYCFLKMTKTVRIGISVTEEPNNIWHRISHPLKY